MIVGIRGNGIAAATCAHLLESDDIQVAIEACPRPPVPTVMLSEATLLLLRGVFDRPLFEDAPRVTRRIVAWGEGEPVAMPHEAVLLSEREVQAELDPSNCARAITDAPADFTMFTVPPMPEGTLHSFGDRSAVAAKVRLRDLACAQECRVEAVEAGWLFLVPDSDDRGWLMSVGAPLDQLLAQSRLIAPLVDPMGGSSVPFMAAPRLFMPLSGPQWLACGTAALGFDPICGDGTAQSVREAILASAVLAEIANGGDADALHTHYQSMLIAAMRRHLLLCAQFYRSGGQGEWWRAQFDALIEGHHWCTRMLATMPEPQYVLRGFRLVPRLEAA